MKINHIEFKNEDITNDLIFSRVMCHKENCLRLLQSILPELHLTKIKKIQTQKNITLQMLRKGIRLDIWAQDDEGNTFDLEMQNTNHPGLVKRAGFYASRITSENLKAGQQYDQIQNSYVIFLCSFDPFGYNKARYDIVNVIKQCPNETVDTGQKIIFLNSKASKTNQLLPDLSAYLAYMNGIILPDNHFINDLEKIRHEYINGKEWHDTMLDLKTWESDLISTFITSLRHDLNCDDDKILAILEKRYGDSYTRQELKDLLKEAE